MTGHEPEQLALDDARLRAPDEHLNVPRFRARGKPTAYRAAPRDARGFKWGLFVWAHRRELVVGVFDPDARGPEALHGSPLGTLDRDAAAALRDAITAWLDDL